MKNINKKILLIISFILTTFLIGCDWEKEVQGPIPYNVNTNKLTPIKADEVSTFDGRYTVNSATVVSNTPDIADFKGKIFVTSKTVDQSLNYYYLLKYNGYNAGENEAEIRQKNNVVLPEYTVLDDNYTIQLTTPLELTNNGKTYKIVSLKKYNDNLIELADNITVQDLDNATASVCDPLQIGGDNCSSINGAVKYIGIYRMEKITCDNQKYVGGVDFAGEMVAEPRLINGANVDLYLYLKAQISNETLKTCMLTADEIANNNILYKSMKYYIPATEAGNLGQVFNNVGLIGIQTGTEVDRTTMIDYAPKDESYQDLTFNGKTITMRLKIMSNGQLNAAAAKTPDGTTPYFSAN